MIAIKSLHLERVAMRQLAAAGLALALIIAGCAAPGSPGAGSRADGVAARNATPKRVIIAIIGDPPNLYMNLASGQNVPGGDALEELVNSGLCDRDNFNVVRARLAQDCPSVENGLWLVLPDGRMETRWNIRATARWHDGTPVTASDFVFTAAVGQDPQQTGRPSQFYDVIESVEAVDPSTVLVRWKRPFIEADTMFSQEASPPLPKHILEKDYLENKEGFAYLPYWTQQYVSAGPFRVREFVGGSHLLLNAHDGYALGRPKIDEIEIRIVPDGNTLIANILAGAVDLQLGRGLSTDQVAVLRAQWKDGRPEVRHSGLVALHPQLLTPNPSILLQPPFRRALLYALDRQQMADTFLGGEGRAAHVWIGQSEPEFQGIESSVARYEYDPQRAVQLIEEQGLRRGPDGLYRDAANQRISLEIRADPGDLQQKSLFAVADYWRQASLEVETVPIPQQLANDREFGTTSPGFRLRLHSTPTSSLRSFHSSAVPRPENRFAGSNVSRYANPELDAAIDRYFTTIPRSERTPHLADTVRHITEQVILVGLFYNVEFTLVSNRVGNVQPRRAASGSAQAWSSYEWDVTT